MQKTYIDKLAFIEIKNRQVLSSRSHGNETWYIPGGKREGDETDEAALIREIKEELSVALKPETITHYGTFEAQAHGKPEGTVVRMTCYQAEYEGVLTPAAEVEELAWLVHADKVRSSPVDCLILDDLKAKGLID